MTLPKLNLTKYERNAGLKNHDNPYRFRGDSVRNLSANKSTGCVNPPIYTVNGVPNFNKTKIDFVKRNAQEVFKSENLSTNATPKKQKPSKSPKIVIVDKMDSNGANEKIHQQFLENSIGLRETAKVLNKQDSR